MDMTVGLATLKEFVKVGFGLATLVADASQGTGMISIFKDVEDAVTLLPEVKDAISHYKDAAASLVALSDPERADLYTYAVSQLHIPQAQVETAVQKALVTFFKLLDVYQMWAPGAAPAPTPAPASAPA